MSIRKSTTITKNTCHSPVFESQRLCCYTTAVCDGSCNFSLSETARCCAWSGHVCGLNIPWSWLLNFQILIWVREPPPAPHIPFKPINTRYKYQKHFLLILIGKPPRKNFFKTGESKIGGMWRKIGEGTGKRAGEKGRVECEER